MGTRRDLGGESVGPIARIGFHTGNDWISARLRQQARPRTFIEACCNRSGRALGLSTALTIKVEAAPSDYAAGGQLAPGGGRSDRLFRRAQFLPRFGRRTYRPVLGWGWRATLPLAGELPFAGGVRVRNGIGRRRGMSIAVREPV